MIDFLKRNAKFVTVIATAVVVIAGLGAALILTNTGHGHRGKDRDTKPDRIMLIDEQGLDHRDRTEVRSAYATVDRSQRSDRIERNDRADRADRSERSDRTERADKPERLPLTEEQIAEKTEKILNKLEQKLADGEITQEEYEEKLEKIQNGDFPISGRSGKHKKTKDIVDGN